MSLPTPDATDEALACRAAGGNPAALHALMGRHQSRLLDFLRSLRLRPCDADDDAKDVWLKV